VNLPPGSSSRPATGDERLGVDAENATGAVELYRSLGMAPAKQWCVVEKRIDSG
jgi:hypothetical protein